MYYTTVHLDARLAKIVHDCAHAFVQAHGGSLQSHYDSFEFAGQRLPDAWRKRLDLEEALTDSLRGAGMTTVAALELVHRWGFNHNALPNLCGAHGWLASYGVAAGVWRSDADKPASALVDSLEALFRHRVGIARISKFIAMPKQSRLGIYDSRVSVALDSVTYEERRLFPLVASRGKNKMLPDQVTPRQLCIAYLLYVEFLRLVARDLNVAASWVEMALFMMGRNRGKKSRPPLHKSLYAGITARNVLELRAAKANPKRGSA